MTNILLFITMSRREGISLASVSTQFEIQDRMSSRTGDYRRNWKSDKTARRSGKRYIVRFYNPLDYASHLEHGFRSHFVPGHWEGNTFVYNRDDPEGGMFVGPKGGYVRGHFTMKRAAKKTKDSQQARVSRKITREINKRMKTK